MKIGVAGLGMIGGSLALALRGRHEVTGFDVSREARDRAAGAGIGVADRLDGLLPADAVIVATPLDAVVATLAALVPRAGDAVLLDVSSVRAPVDAFANATADGPSIVGVHPMAGRSARGFAAADPAILSGRPFLVVPTARSDARAMAIAGDIARDAGGVVTVCSSAEHDRIVALVSALPLAVAAAVSLVAGEAAVALENVAGPGYRDATRLALTSPDLGEALLTLNASNVSAAIARLRAVLEELERAVAEGDAAAVRALLERAASGRAVLG
jgi:prephenate dehydrogenase